MREKRGDGFSLQKAMLGTLPPMNWSQISEGIPSLLVIMSHKEWDGGEGRMAENGRGSQTSVTQSAINKAINATMHGQLSHHFHLYREQVLTILPAVEEGCRIFVPGKRKKNLGEPCNRKEREAYSIWASSQHILQGLQLHKELRRWVHIYSFQLERHGKKLTGMYGRLLKQAKKL